MNFASNELSGLVPSFLFALPAIRVLDLSNNSFIQPLPPVAMDSIQYVGTVAGQ